jgi:unsaturated rhamnogalacturonyl hydrolase
MRTAVSIFGGCKPCKNNKKMGDTMKPDTAIVQKVKQALMSIQRRSWEQCEAMQAMLELRDYDTLVTFAREISYIRLDDGRTTLTSDWEKRTVTDPCACGEALMVAAQLTGDRLIKETYDMLLDYTLNRASRNPEGILYHMNDAPEFWVDSIYMLPPFLASAGYYEEGVKQINGYWNALYDPKIKMLNWIWNDVEKRFVRMHHRSCTGYAAVGLVKVVVRLPAIMQKEKKDMMVKAKIVIDSILRFINEDGVCHDTLDNPDSIIGINAVSMVVGAIYRARAAGYLDDSYEKTADRLRKSLHEKVDPYGFLYGVCGVPDNNKTGISSNGQSFFLMMEAAYCDYAENPANLPDAWYNGMFKEGPEPLSDYMEGIRQ